MTVFVDHNHPVIGVSSRGGLLYLTATGVQELDTCGDWQKRVSWVDLTGAVVTLKSADSATDSGKDAFKEDLTDLFD